MIRDGNGDVITEDNPLAIAIATMLGTLSMNHEYTDNTQWKQTHNAVSVGATSTSAETTFSPVPDGMTEFINNLIIDAAVDNVYTSVIWSDDGTNISGKTSITTSNTLATNYKTTDNWKAVGGLFYKVEVWNGAGVTRICSANIKFRP